jgi:A/G-specific adenine glycosylase
VETKDFQELIWQKGRELYRAMPWREDTRAYYILVSELMLQQTQVERVISKFLTFVERFPDEKSLANASLGEVLSLWNGLGYNRRAKFLHEATKMIVTEFGGVFPLTIESLQRLPGVGRNTAGAIMNYAFDKPVVFVETNVRSVYFEHFFQNGEIVTDKELANLVESTLDKTNPREFYWALMDYGAWLKKNGAARLQQSKHYKKQSPLRGSVREVRGKIIRLLTEKDVPFFDMKVKFQDDDRFDSALDGLIKDGLIQQTKGKLHLTK